VKSFKDWLKNEEMTSTSCVAHFQDRLRGIFRSNWWLSDLEKNKNNNRKKRFTYQVPQVKN
jgi:hypothetical protein